jgi:hypothetical protein
MAGLMAGVTIMLILSAVAFQSWSDVIRRDNEAEMIFRAEDLVRAIQRYRKDHGGMGPMKLEDLMEPGPKGQYYLRRLWKDPLVKDGKWGLLHIGPGGQIIDPNAEMDTSGMGGGGLGGGLGGGFGGGLGGDRMGTRQPQSVSASNLSQGQTARGGLSKSPLNPGDPSQLEGLPIAGVRTLCEDHPFRVHNGLTEYREWLFTYLDLELQAAPGQRKRQLDAQGGGLQQRGGGMGAQTPGQTGGTQQTLPQQQRGTQLIPNPHQQGKGRRR